MQTGGRLQQQSGMRQSTSSINQITVSVYRLYM
jgi:hypothetical protein